MALYTMSNDSIEAVAPTTFMAENLRERDDLQRLLRDHIEVIVDDALVISEEYGNWEGSHRRIDLLAIDSSGNLVVIELKRTEDAGHSELQALRYAAFISTMTFDQAATAFREYKQKRGIDNGDAEVEMRRFMGNPEGEFNFNRSVRILLVANDFSHEVTASVLWLNSQGLDITCIRMQPYRHKAGEPLLLDVQQLIPLPQAANYQIAIREQEQERKIAKSAARDLTKYRLVTDLGSFENLSRKDLMLHVVKAANARGVSIQKILECVPWRTKNMFFPIEGPQLTAQQLREKMPFAISARYFTEDDNLFFEEEHTYALTNKWGDQTERAVNAIIAACPTPSGISYSAEDPV
jgi:hypothetical protein